MATTIEPSLPTHGLLVIGSPTRTPPRTRPSGHPCDGPGERPQLELSRETGTVKSSSFAKSDFDWTVRTVVRTEMVTITPAGRCIRSSFVRECAVVRRTPTDAG